jgi:hypothetical protein
MPNGNKKMDSAYREAMKEEHCPIILFFSVIKASSSFLVVPIFLLFTK